MHKTNYAWDKFVKWSLIESVQLSRSSLWNAAESPNSTIHTFSSSTCLCETQQKYLFCSQKKFKLIYLPCNHTFCIQGESEKYMFLLHQRLWFYCIVASVFRRWMVYALAGFRNRLEIAAVMCGSGWFWLRNLGVPTMYSNICVSRLNVHCNAYVYIDQVIVGGCLYTHLPTKFHSTCLYAECM